MTGGRIKLYAEELLRKITNEKELKVLEAAWDDGLAVGEKIELLIKEESKCSSSK